MNFYFEIKKNSKFHTLNPKQVVSLNVWQRAQNSDFPPHFSTSTERTTVPRDRIYIYIYICIERERERERERDSEREREGGEGEKERERDVIK